MGAGSTLTTRRTPQQHASPGEVLRLGAIDVGSNSIHMVIAQADADGGITTLWRLKEMVGLGRMSFPSRRLSREAMDNALASLARFQQAAQQRQAEKVIAVATSAIREAENGGDFIERAKRQLKLPIRVISAREEARLIYVAVRHAVDLKHGPHLIMDVGGGSVEFIVGNEHQALLLESLKLGAARMSARFVKSDPISKEDHAALLRHYDRELTPICAKIAELKPKRVIGTSGTLETLAAMCGEYGESNGHGEAGAGPEIERERLEDLVSHLVKADADERNAIRGLDSQRQEQILAGALLVQELMRRLRARKIEICGSALREGILLDYLGRHLPELSIRREVPDARRRSVLDLARRCDWHRKHSEQVAHLTMRLFDETKSLHKLGTIERELIEYAALLHDIGWHIDGKGHHKHSMYLILNGKLKNFAEEEVQIMAAIARYHRKSLPKRKHAFYQALPLRSRRVVDVGASLLRIGDGLDRSHASVVKDLRCRTNSEGVKCILSTRADAELEIWGARRKGELFTRTFGGRAITFEIAKS